MVVLTLKAKHDHLRKLASTRDYVRVIGEFVWNALDADATKVSVSFLRNALGGIESITIADNGTGISKLRAAHDFESLGESWKLSVQRTKLHSRVIHGKEGKGRLRFFSLAHNARWITVYKDGNQFFRLSIDINADQLQTCSVSEPENLGTHAETGTIVELTPLKDTFDWLLSEGAHAEFTAIFAPYVLQYPNCAILYNDQPIDPKATIERSYTFETKPIVCPGRIVRDMSLRVIEWKVNSESRKIYFGSESGVVLGSQPANVVAPGYEFSVYAYSPFFQEIADANLLEFDALVDPDFAQVLQYIRDQVGDYFRIRQAERSSELIQDLKDAGAYPYEGDPKDEVELRERQVFDIATHAATSYSREFKSADISMKKITLALLKETISHNPESLTRILRAVFNLPKVRQDEFSNLLAKTELGNIIAASNLIADRVVALKVLREMVFDPKHRASVRERGELDTLIRDNTWIFGENFHITMPEAGLTKVMNRVSDELALKRPKRKVKKLDGKIGRIDSFMGRVVPHPDPNHREFILVELKRPSIKIGRDELDQLEDYVNAILRQPDYINTSTSWYFYLVTSEYDDTIRQRVTQDKWPIGLFQDKPHYQVWVKTWSEIIASCEARLNFVQEKLRIEVSAQEVEGRIAQLKSSLLKLPPEPAMGDLAPFVG